MKVQPGPHFPFSWRKSSHSANEGNCVEIATRVDYVLARDSNEQNGPMLVMTSTQWEQFLVRISK